MIIRTRTSNSRREALVDDPAPGGWVCGEPDPAALDGICGRPIESEPCTTHWPDASED